MKDLRYCRAARLLLAALALLFALTSCDHGWLGDPRLVNKRHDKTDSDSSGTVSDGDEATVEEGETDPFEVDEEWNKIDYVFDGNKFDTSELVLYKTTFDNSNIPEYAFGERSAGWTLSDESTCAYTYNAKNEGNKAQGYSITSLTVYQYRGKNPLYDANSNYNTGTRVQRFRFYKIDGKAMYIVELKQHLIAVDTYSKFVFAYGKIIDTDSFLGQKIPTEYDAIENHGDYQFYEYDPIGYVKDDGTVVLYSQYETDMKNASNGLEYVPLIHDGYTEMASHSSSGEGRSPYYPGLYE